MKTSGSMNIRSSGYITVGRKDIRDSDIKELQNSVLWLINRFKIFELIMTLWGEVS